MSVNMHLRDLPDHVHETLVERAAERGMSLRQYTIEVLEQHCAVPTLDSWLDRIARRRALGLQVDAARAVAEGRAADDGDDGRRVG